MEELKELEDTDADRQVLVSFADTQTFENLGLEQRLSAEARDADRLLASTVRNKEQ